MKRTAILLSLISLVAAWPMLAQVAQPAQPMGTTQRGVAAPAQMPAVSPELSNALSQLERVSQQMANDVGRISIKKWKTDSSYKQQYQHDADSIQANVTGTLPELVSQVRANPNDVANMFKLYRNVDALYDVLKGLTESAGAFGPKSEFDVLQSDAQNLMSVRANLGAQVDAVATAQQTEMSQLRAQLAQARASAQAAPPKKIIVDDEPKKPVKKKKAPAKPAATKTAPAKSQSPQ